MTAIFLMPTWPPMIQPASLARNGQIDSAMLEGQLRTHTNMAMYYRTKDYFVTPGYYNPRAGASGTRDRWYFYGHSGPVARRVRVRIVLAKDDNGGGHAAADAYAKFSIYTTGGVQIGSSLEFHHGSSGTSASNVPDEWGTFTGTVDIDPNIDFYGKFEEVDYARIITAIVYEEALMPDTDNGYFAGISAGVNIYDNHRGDLATMLHNEWKQGAATAIKWAVADAAAALRTTVSATGKNIIDNSSTAVSASSPGFYLDFTGKNRLSETTVPCVLAAWGRYTAGAAGKHGTVTIKDSSGTTVGSITDGWNSGAAALATATINMPLTAQKFDVWYSTSSGTFDLYAVCLIEYA